MTAEKAIAERVAKQLGLDIHVDGSLRAMQFAPANYRWINIDKMWDALMAAETRLEAERWRSVEKDGLPEYGRIVWISGGPATWNGQHWVSLLEGRYPIIWEVTHWMPYSALPKPPITPPEESKP